MAMPCKRPIVIRSDPRLNRISSEGPDAVRKRGSAFRLLREVEAMEYVRLHTSIPVPTVLSVHIEAEDNVGENWFLMERLPGDQLRTAWPNMKVEAKSETTRQLGFYLDQLRRLRPTGGDWIGSCSKGPAYDHRIDNTTTCGPFASVSEFNDFLVAPIKHFPKPEWAAKYRCQLSDTHEIHFAHADISSENILVDPVTGYITGVIDWEMAGFWPAWWEYRKALFGSRCQPWWTDLVKEVMQEYPLETEVDMDLEMF